MSGSLQGRRLAAVGITCEGGPCEGRTPPALLVEMGRFRFRLPVNGGSTHGPHLQRRPPRLCAAECKSAHLRARCRAHDSDARTAVRAPPARHVWGPTPGPRALDNRTCARV